MEQFLGILFRAFFYMLFGAVLEVIFSTKDIDRALGHKIPRRVPFKYREGFVSLYMFPLHAFGMVFGFEFIHAYIKEWNLFVRFVIWAILITGAEILWGMLQKKVLGFYTWDYYKESRYKVFQEGYTLWTLVPLWGMAGIIMEQFSQLLIYLTPHFLTYIKGL